MKKIVENIVRDVLAADRKTVNYFKNKLKSHGMEIDTIDRIRVHNYDPEDKKWILRQFPSPQDLDNTIVVEGKIVNTYKESDQSYKNLKIYVENMRGALETAEETDNWSEMKSLYDGFFNVPAYNGDYKIPERLSIKQVIVGNLKNAVYNKDSKKVKENLSLIYMKCDGVIAKMNRYVLESENRIGVLRELFDVFSKDENIIKQLAGINLIETEDEKSPASEDKNKITKGESNE